MWIILLTLVVFECLRSQKRIAATQGEISLLDSNQIYWHKQTYRIFKQPVLLKNGVFLRIEETKGHKPKRTRIWVAVDSMEQTNWRSLRQLLLQWKPENG